MTVAAITTQTTYALAGTALGPFSTVWPYANPSDVTVQIDYGEGAGPQPLVQGADYMLAANNPTLSNGGLVTLAAYVLSNFGAAWGPGAEIILGRVTPRSQPSAFGEAVGFSPRGSEQALDNVERQVQEIGSRADRALVVPAPELGGTLPPAAERAGMYLGFDINGLPITLPGGALALPNVLATIATLRALTPAFGAPWALVAAYAKMSDGGGGLFIYDSQDGASADNGGTVIVDTCGRRWKRSYTGRATAAMFGAVSDWAGVPGQGTDNAPALQRMLNALGYIYGDGVYRCCAGLVCANDQVSIEGTTRTRMELVFDGPIATGLTLGNTAALTDKTTVSLKNLRILTTQAAAGLAVLIQSFGDINDDRSNIRAAIDDVEITGDSQITQGWWQGISFVETQQIRMTGVAFMGMGGASSPNDTQANNTRSSVAIGVSGNDVPDSLKAVGCWFYNWMTGIAWGGNGEGLDVIACDFVNVYDALQVAYGGTGQNFGQQLICVSDSHLNVYHSAVTGLGIPNFQFHDNVVFHSTRATQVGNLLDLTKVSIGHIHHNQFEGYNATYPSNVIVLETGNANLSIADNIFQSAGGAGGGLASAIWIRTAADYGHGNFGYNSPNVIQGNNQYNGTFTVSAYKNDTPTANDRNVVGRPSALISRSVPIGFANSAGANTPFDTVVHDSAGFYTGPYSLTIPAGSGISRVRVSGGGNWDANATGMRQIEIRKNGSPTYPGVGCQGAPTLGAATTHEQSVVTGIIPVVEGDSFQLVTLHTAGITLNFNNAWMGIEAVV
jgi:hypothetical protein